MNTTVTLPKKPSELLRLAWEDVRQIRKDKRYAFEMGEWCQFHDDGPCLVCVAGAIMVKSLGLTKRDSRKGHSFQDEILPADTSEGEALKAVDDFRTGCIHLALTRVRGVTEVDKDVLKRLREAHSDAMQDPDRDYAAWSRAWRKFIKALEKEGL